MSKLVLTILIIVLILAVLAVVFFFYFGGKGSGAFQIQGMKVEVLNKGSGNAVKKGDTITVNYEGMLADGKKFDSSIERNMPFTFKFGEGNVIKGWDLGLEGIKVGEKRRLIIPPELAYGANGFPPIIPQNATLTFEVELLKINP